MRFNPSRISAGLLVFFAATHTYGGVLFPPSAGPASDAVFDAMRSVHFQMLGANVSWRGFHLGLGLDVTLFLLFAAFLAWFLGGLSPQQRAPFAPVTWALFMSQVGVAILSWTYFFVPPGVTSTIVAVLLGVECVRTRSSEALALSRT
jgi:hypothetical protein